MADGVERGLVILGERSRMVAMMGRQAKLASEVRIIVSGVWWYQNQRGFGGRDLAQSAGDRSTQRLMPFNSGNDIESCKLCLCSRLSTCCRAVCFDGRGVVHLSSAFPSIVRS